MKAIFENLNSYFLFMFSNSMNIRFTAYIVSFFFAVFVGRWGGGGGCRVEGRGRGGWFSICWVFLFLFFWLCIIYFLSSFLKKLVLKRTLVS